MEHVTCFCLLVLRSWSFLDARQDATCVAFLLHLLLVKSFCIKITVFTPTAAVIVMLLSRKIRTAGADQSLQSQSLQPLQPLQPQSLTLTFKKGGSGTLANDCQGVEKMPQLIRRTSSQGVQRSGCGLQLPVVGSVWGTSVQGQLVVFNWTS